MDLEAGDLGHQDEDIQDDGSHWEDIVDGDEEMEQSPAKESHQWVR